MAAKKRKRILWVTLTLLVLASAAIFSLKAINSKPAKIDPYLEVIAFFQQQNKPADMDAAIQAAQRSLPADAQA